MWLSSGQGGSGSHIYRNDGPAPSGHRFSGNHCPLTAQPALFAQLHIFTRTLLLRWPWVRMTLCPRGFLATRNSHSRCPSHSCLSVFCAALLFVRASDSLLKWDLWEGCVTLRDFHIFKKGSVFELIVHLCRKKRFFSRYKILFSESSLPLVSGHGPHVWVPSMDVCILWSAQRAPVNYPHFPAPYFFHLSTYHGDLFLSAGRFISFLPSA